MLKIILRKKYFLLIILMLATFLVANTFSLIVAREFTCDDYGKEELTTEELDQIIAICDQEIEQQRDKLKEKQEETTGVKYEIQKLDRKIKIAQSYVNAKIAKANKLKKSISKNRDDIDDLNERLKITLESLETLIRLTYQTETYTKIETVLSTGSVSDFFYNIESIRVLQKSISKEVSKTKEEKESLEDLSSELEERESAERTLALEKAVENNKIKKNKSYKNELLDILEEEEGVFKEKIKVTEEVRQRILRRKYRLASGVEISFGDALNLLQPYESKFEMDSAFVLAILFQESGWGGNIGGNIGQCTYNQNNSHGNSKGGYTVMSNPQKDNFLKIMNGLGINPESQPISCPIPSDGSYGGAMGPAQFMPNTWMGIRDSAAVMLGARADDLSPFINQDAFIASAAYLKQQYYSSSCSDYANKYSHISPKKTLRERCAASRYYAGNNWWKYRFSYGESVVKRADRFREDIKTLNQ